MQILFDALDGQRNRARVAAAGVTEKSGKTGRILAADCIKSTPMNLISGLVDPTSSSPTTSSISKTPALCRQKSFDAIRSDTATAASRRPSMFALVPKAATSMPNRGVKLNPAPPEGCHRLRA